MKPILLAILVTLSLGNFLSFKIDEQLAQGGAMANPFDIVNQQQQALPTTPPPSSSLQQYKCKLCEQTYENNFDIQILLEGNICEEKGIDKEACVAFLKGLAYKYFDQGADEGFDKDTQQKIKQCKPQDKQKWACKGLAFVICDLLANQGLVQQCKQKNNQSTFVQQQQEFRMKQVNNRMTSNSSPAPLDSQLSDMLSNLQQDMQQSGGTAVQPVQPTPQFKGVYDSVDKQLQEIQQLEGVVKDYDKKLKEARQKLFNKIIQAQASSKAIQQHLTEIVSRVSSEVKM